jgi:hypothetical protein
VKASLKYLFCTTIAEVHYTMEEAEPTAPIQAVPEVQMVDMEGMEAMNGLQGATTVAMAVYPVCIPLSAIKYSWVAAAAPVI